MTWDSDRAAIKTTFAVWKALFLRESLTRFFGRRAAWFWLLLEPLAHIAIMSLIFAVIRHRTVGNMETMLWIVLGMLGFFTFRRTAVQASKAVESNRALFAFRQVTPVDTVIVRAGLELMMMCILAIIVFFALAMMDYDVTPYDAIEAIVAALGLWTFGLALAFVLSSLSEIAPDLRQIVDVMMMPLYFISGVIIPMNVIPEPYRGYLMWNPIANGLEALREAFSPYYHAAPQTSLSYLYFITLAVTVLGLIAHRHYRTMMVAK